MKKITLTIIAITILNLALSQEKKDPKSIFSMTLNLELFSPLELRVNDSIPELNQVLGFGFDWQLDFDKWTYSLVTDFGLNAQEKFGYESRLSYSSVGIFAGRRLKLHKNFEIVPMLGYNYSSYIYRISNTNQTIDFNSPFTATTREYKNSAHRIVPKIAFRLFDNFQIATSYHWDVSKKIWEVENGTLINSPKENFSSFRVTLNYLFL